MQALTFQGPLLNSNNGHEWLPEATLFLRQNRVYRMYTTDPPAGWELKTDEIDAQDAAVAQLASMVTRTLREPIIGLSTAREAWKLVLESYIKQDEQRAHSVIGRITKLTFDQGQDPITFTERLESLFFEHNAYAKSHMSEDSLVRHLLEAVKPNSSLEMWARERLRQSSSYEWDGLMSEFIELAKDVSNRVPHIAVVATGKGPATTGQALTITLHREVTQITVDEVITALIGAGFKACHRHRTLSHANGDCLNTRPHASKPQSKNKAPPQSERSAVATDDVEVLGVQLSDVLKM